MNGSIFISYRRGDGGASAGRLYDHLERHFGGDRLFFDVDTIRPGLDFVQVLEDKVDECDVLLAIVGRSWVETRDSEGRRRLDNPEDFVRVEIVRALSAGKRVIPILVEGAEMPQSTSLPEPLRPLARRNAMRIDHDSFRVDSDRLVKALNATLAELAERREAEQQAKTRAAKSEGAKPKRSRAAAKARKQDKAAPSVPDAVAQHAAEARSAPAVAENDLGIDPDSPEWDDPEVDRMTDEWAWLVRRQAAKEAYEAKKARFLEEGGSHQSAAAVADGMRTAENTLSLEQTATTPTVADATISNAAIDLPFPQVDTSDDAKSDAAQVLSPPTPAKDPVMPPEAMSAATGSQPPTTNRRFLISGGAVFAAAAATSPWWFGILGSSVREIAAEIVLSGHTGPLRDAAFERTGGLVATASEDMSVRVWRVLDGGLFKLVEGHRDVVSRVRFSPAGVGTSILTASDDYTARIWSGSKLGDVRVLEGHTAFVKAAAWSPDAKLVVTGGGVDARMWNAETGNLIATLAGHEEPIQFATYAGDGNYFVTTSDDKSARVWHANLGTSAAVLTGHESLIVDADFTGDSNNLVTASWDGSARQWRSWWSGVATHVLQHENWVTAARYSPDTTRIVTASFDRTASLWEAQTGARIAILSGHADALGDAAFSPDGSLIVTASHDGTARLWNGVTGAPLAVLAGHGNTVAGAVFSPDGRRVLTWSTDMTARIWPVPGDILAV